MASDARDIEDSTGGVRFALHHAVFEHSIYKEHVRKGAQFKTSERSTYE